MFWVKAQEPSPSCALLAHPPTSMPEGQGVAAQLPRECRVSLHYPRSLPFPNSCSPPPAGESHKSGGSVLQVGSDPQLMMLGQDKANGIKYFLCQDEVKRI